MQQADAPPRARAIPNNVLRQIVDDRFRDDVAIHGAVRGIEVEQVKRHVVVGEQGRATIAQSLRGPASRVGGPAGGQNSCS